MENLFTMSKKIIVLVSLFFLFSCSQDEMVNSDLQQSTSKSLEEKMKTCKVNVFKGPQMALGNGKVRSWISLDRSGNPYEIGIEMTAKAFDDLSITHHKKNAIEHETIVVPLHPKAQQSTPFNHIGLNWNPQGHDPDGVFDVPHFDIHFYMISVEEQMAIPAWSVDTDSVFNIRPPVGYMPADYDTPPGAATAEAQMGKHWLPINLGDYLPFSKIMIYGSYDGQLIFVEPMVTLEYLLSNEDIRNIDYSQPEYFEKPGNYPTKYNIYHDAVTGNTYITLSGFVARN